MWRALRDGSALSGAQLWSWLHLSSGGEAAGTEDQSRGFDILFKPGPPSVIWTRTIWIQIPFNNLNLFILLLTLIRCAHFPPLSPCPPSPVPPFPLAIATLFESMGSLNIWSNSQMLKGDISVFVKKHRYH